VHCLAYKRDIKVGMIIGFYGRLNGSHSHDWESVHGRHHRKHTTGAGGSDRGSGEGSGGVGVESSSSRCALFGHH
jgi:hypothetical protein